MHVVLGGELADGRHHSVKPPDSITLDRGNLVLEGAQHLEVCGVLESVVLVPTPTGCSPQQTRGLALSTSLPACHGNGHYGPHSSSV